MTYLKEQSFESTDIGPVNELHQRMYELLKEINALDFYILPASTQKRIDVMVEELENLGK